MLSAHMDEVGLIVTHITEKGLLKFDTVGGILKMVLCGLSVTVLGKNGPVNGVMGCAPVHLMKGKDGDKPMPVEDLSIDIGARSREEAARWVSPGDRAVFDSIWDASRGRIIGKALDDRAGLHHIDRSSEIRSSLRYDLCFYSAGRGGVIWRSDGDECCETPGSHCGGIHYRGGCARRIGGK